MSFTHVRPAMRGPTHPVVLGAGAAVITTFTAGFTAMSGLIQGFDVILTSPWLVGIAVTAVAAAVATVALFAFAIMRAITEDLTPAGAPPLVSVHVDEGGFYAQEWAAEQAANDPNNTLAEVA